MGTRLRIALINIVGGIVACIVTLLLLPSPTGAADVGQHFPEATSHRSLIAPAAETPDAPAQLPDGELPVMSVTLTGSGDSHEGAQGVYVLNQTDFKPDYGELLSAGSPVLPQEKDGAAVLILHTHGTEAYSRDGAVSYNPDISSVRSENTDENVVAVGRALKEALERRGVSVVHDETMCDIPSFNQAYTKSLSTAEAAIANNPSVKVIVDLHRDSMINSQGVKYRPVAEIGGRYAAQMMLVVGTSQNGKQHEGWQDNLRFAMALQRILVDNYPGLMRPINLRADRFNQHLAAGAVLVEVGSCGNSLEESRYSAELLASALAGLLK